jgi:DNA repair exonuclease SbcCD ATPase subunit
MRGSRQAEVGGYSRDSESGLDLSSPSVQTLTATSQHPEKKKEGGAGGAAQGFTEDWIRQHLANEPRSERNNWLSDDSAEVDARASKPRTDLDPSDEDWLGLNDNSAGDDTPTTPTLASFVRRKTRARSGDLTSPADQSPHKASRSSGQVPQATFWDVFRPSSESSPASTKKRSSRFGKTTMDSGRSPKFAMDKPLPTPPSFERTSSDAPVPKASPTLSPSTTKPTGSSMQSFRGKKKIAWKGKQCIIALPPDDTRSSTFLTPEDVEARLGKWKEEGYDISGFGLVVSRENNGVDAAGGQSRPVFPDAEEIRREWREKNYKVSMPDLGLWKEYVKSLQEEKLRALGVSFGDEDPPRKKSPISASMSRTSSQYPTHTSPPFPPSSVASNHVLQNNNMFSPPFNPSTNPSSHVGSVASPGSQYAGLQGNGHFSKPSVAFPANEHPYGSPFQFPLPQPTPPIQGSRSPQHYFTARQEGSSPAIQPNLQSLSAVLSPASPASYENNSQNHNDLFARYSLQQQALQAQSIHQQLQLQNHQLNPSYAFTSQGVNASEPQVAQIVSNRTHLDIAHPTPQGHRHNVSETLQKEIDEAESHLEESIRHQLEDNDSDRPLGDLAKSQWADLSSLKLKSELRSPPTEDSKERDDATTLADSVMNKYEEKLDGSDIDTNPSLSGEGLAQEQSLSDQRFEVAARPNYQQHTHKPTLNAAASPFHFQPGHKSKPSTLNVEAKEFKFNPQSRFAAGNFSFTGNAFQPLASQFNPSASAFLPTIPKYGTLGSTRSGLNVAAPAFTPTVPPARGLPSGEFSFSSTFNADAPPFNPSQSFTSDTGASGLSSPEEPSKDGPKIFGKVDLSNSSGAFRRSKAVPIVRPDADTDGEMDGIHEDEMGRLAPSLSRSKRARRGDSDGDKVPLFATPSHPLNETGQAQSPHRDAPNHSPARSHGKENVTPRTSNGSGLPPIVSIPDTTAHFIDSKETPQSDVGTWSPFEFRDRVDAANFSAAHPSSPGKHGRTEISVEYLTNEEHEALLHEPYGRDAISPDHQHAQSGRSRSISPLAANAELFDINSSMPQYVYISELSDDPDAKGKEIDASNLAHSPPPGSESSVHSSSKDVEGQDDIESEVEAGAIDQSQDTLSVSEVSELEQRHHEHNAGHVHQDSVAETSFQEIDAVMKHLNDEDSDLGVEETQSPWTRSSPVKQGPSHYAGFTPAQQLHPTTNIRSDAPSPSPRRVQQLYQHPQQDSTDIDLQSRSDPIPPRTFGLGIQAPIHRLNNPENTIVSDWDDALSSAEEVKLQHRSQFFDSHVNNIIGGILETRLGPLERSVNVIQQSVSQLAKRSTSQRKRRSLSVDLENSDADDEDDDEERAPVHRSTSAGGRREGRGEGIKAAVLEALAAHHASASDKPLNVDLSRIHEVLAEMKLLAEPAALQNRSAELKGVVEDVISTHPRLRGNRVAGDISAEKIKLQTDGLESMLRIANDRTEEEYRARRAAEEELATVRRSLQSAKEEAAQHRESAEEAEQSLRLFHEDKQRTLTEALQRASALEDQLDDLQTTKSQLSEQNAALESTLDEYRLSSDDWRQALDDAKGESIQLLKTIEKIKHQMEENIDASGTMKSKFVALQEEMVAARRDIAKEQSAWRRREEDLLLKLETLQTRFDKEVKTNEKLELEVEQLEVQEKEGLRLKIAFDQSQEEILRLEGVITKVQHDSWEHQNNAARFEREFNDARESARIEVQRTRSSLEADIETANNQVNVIRDSLEGEISRLQARVESVKLDADTQAKKHELLLEEANNARRAALSEATQNREAAMQEQHRVHERALNDLRERHGRALHNASEDKQRIELHLSERLRLEESKNEHLRDKVSHLEEKLEIAKSAALAAAQAAQSAKAPTITSPSRPSSSKASMPLNRGSDIPEKISPQALRESILSLQEQLHEREGRLEELEQELSEVDKDAPGKIKDRDTEISWLRELLGVRIDDLQDIINTLSSPEYDRDAVRDAAIRLKANLQMEQQEKERAIASGQRLPPLDIISNFASPRALPRAATFAMERLNKVRDSSISSSLSDIASMGGDTPSRITSGAQSFFSSWMNTPTATQRPPTLNLSTTPSTITTMGGRRISTESRPLGTYNAQRSASTRKRELQPEGIEEPSTPSLLRKSSYDMDAESTILGPSLYADENRRPLEAYSAGSQQDTAGPFSP